VTDFAKELVGWRKKHQWVQKEAADVLHVELRAYQNWEQGHCEPRDLAIETLRRRMAMIDVEQISK
jgi:DNA-binding transcriptional regulator YiaG